MSFYCRSRQKGGAYKVGFQSHAQQGYYMQRFLPLSLKSVLSHMSAQAHMKPSPLCEVTLLALAPQCAQITTVAFLALVKDTENATVGI